MFFIDRYRDREAKDRHVGFKALWRSVECIHEKREHGGAVTSRTWMEFREWNGTGLVCALTVLRATASWGQNSTTVCGFNNNLKKYTHDASQQVFASWNALTYPRAHRGTGIRHHPRFTVDTNFDSRALGSYKKLHSDNGAQFFDIYFGFVGFRKSGASLVSVAGKISFEFFSLTMRVPPFIRIVLQYIQNICHIVDIRRRASVKSFNAKFYLLAPRSAFPQFM